MRIVFCGNPEFAVPTLEALLTSRHHVAAVVCSPDKPRGRGQKVEPLPIKQVAHKAGLIVLQPKSLSETPFLSEVRELKPDCLVVVAFRILPRELFALPPWGSVNVHPSLLPRGRGPAPIRWTLLNGESETGVSIIQLTERVDAGGILKQAKIPVAPEDDYGSLHDQLATLGAELLISVLEDFEKGVTPEALPQDENQTSRAPKIHASDRVIDWTLPSLAIINRIRALSPEPGALGVTSGYRLKILRADHPSRPNMVLSPGDVSLLDNQLFVGTGDSLIRLITVQPEGKRPMSAGDYLRGRPSVPTSFVNPVQE